MIEQQVALNRLVGLALTRLRADPLRESGRYPGDLPASVLRVNAAFWEPLFDPEVATRKLAESLRERSDLKPELRELVRTFIRDHPHRSASDFRDEEQAAPSLASLIQRLGGAGRLLRSQTRATAHLDRAHGGADHPWGPKHRRS